MAPDRSKPAALKVRFEPRAGYLYASVTGEQDSLEGSRAAWEEISAACKAGGYGKVLVEENIATTIEVAEIYDLCEQLVDLGFEGIQIAFVDRMSAQSEDNMFAEDVAVNRGVWGRFFSSVSEAEAWLLA